jgi:hypothetical protein
MKVRGDSSQWGKKRIIRGSLIFWGLGFRKNSGLGQPKTFNFVDSLKLTGAIHKLKWTNLAR